MDDSSTSGEKINRDNEATTKKITNILSTEVLAGDGMSNRMESYISQKTDFLSRPKKTPFTWKRVKEGVDGAGWDGEEGGRELKGREGEGKC